MTNREYIRSLDNNKNNQTVYRAIGERTYYYTNGSIAWVDADYRMGFDWDVYDIDIVGDLFSGEEFYEYVNDGSITNRDGIIGYIFADGYVTNLGLKHKRFEQGNFLVDGDAWMALCQNHLVKVAWCNK